MAEYAEAIPPCAATYPFAANVPPPPARERQHGERRAEEYDRGVAHRQQMLVLEQKAAEC